MSSTVLITILSLSLLAFIAAILLFIIAEKFKVYEDPRIDEVQAALPAANCGGCGFAGCRNFAEALVKADSFEGLNCPVGGAAVMAEAATILGRIAPVVDPTIAVLLCNGTPESRPLTRDMTVHRNAVLPTPFILARQIAAMVAFGKGDCEKACKFDALYIDHSTGLPVISDEKCVSCGACVKACPRNLIELRKKAKKDRKIYVACSNCDKGGPARRACKVACIGCGKCVKVCAFDAITLKDNLAYIDAGKCTFCRKCAPECPTNAIIEVNFPPRKPKVEAGTEVASA